MNQHSMNRQNQNRHNMNRRRPRGALVLLIVLATAAAALGACSGSAGTDPDDPGRGGGTLRILAGSELRDLDGLLDDFRRQTGIQVTLEYTGTLDAVDRITAGTTDADAAWLASDRYLRLALGDAPDRSRTIVDRATTMMSPVVLGVRSDLARRFGWVDNKVVTWADVARKVATGEFTFAMTSPSSSNSGFSALVGVAAALAGTSDALTLDDIHPVALTSFFAGQVLTAGSSGWLTDAFVRSATPIGGMINYESEILALNAGALRDDPLTIIYPRDGVITADYPLQLLHADAAHRGAYDRLVSWLRTPDVQRRIATTTYRRPATPGVRLDPAPWPAPELPAQLPFPATSEIADHLLAAYQDEYRRPSHAIFVLDVSPSMRGERLELLRSTLRELAGTGTSTGRGTGTDDTLEQRFARFRERERVTLITFSGTVHDTLEFTVNDPQPGSADLTAISAAADGLTLGSGTAIYSALEAAYRYVADSAAAPADGVAPLTSIVLMTDGENNQGTTADAFHSSYLALPDAARSVRTFTVVFGDARVDEMRTIADWTGGAMFDARTSSLSEAFREIRGYQ
ncbi:VWA domain-containing protein [Parafrankia sp. EUN1f]|uniref:VWA domain-containing protein n=1 Tax=Parafrankia sp. EUN1f TaxID=102897 RepID=UPI001E313303|nr:VWA domain-containing protein [Parafrankia sp. EUN1f]